MSVQFRSRIKSTIDYSKILNGVGVCCDKNGNKKETTFYQCFNEGGDYTPARSIDEVNCVPVDTEQGCCCACSYVTQPSSMPYPWDLENSRPYLASPYLESGLECGISRCECERIGGKFTPYGNDINEDTVLEESNWQPLCLVPFQSSQSSGQIDARYPRACCHVDFDEASSAYSLVTCDNVCTAADCSAFGTTEYPSVFTEDSVCGPTRLTRSSTPYFCTNPLTLTKMLTKTNKYSDQSFGSCYTLEKNDNDVLEYVCDITPQTLCNGYWVKATNLSESFCNDKFTPNDPIKTQGSYEPQKLTQNEFNSLNLTVGDKYQGGVYIGVFEPGNPINAKGSKLYGNLNFSSPSEFYPDNIGIGDSYRKWAIIVDEKIYKLPFLESSEEDISYNTSLWDGYYNTYGDRITFNGIKTKLANTIKYKPKNGFIDYYLPSIHELYFYSMYLKTKNINIGTQTPVLSSTLFNTKYLNSNTSKTKINNAGLVYGQVLKNNSSNKFSTLLLTKNIPTDVLFFRKIIIE